MIQLEDFNLLGGDFRMEELDLTRTPNLEDITHFYEVNSVESDCLRRKRDAKNGKSRYCQPFVSSIKVLSGAQI